MEACQQRVEDPFMQKGVLNGSLYKKRKRSKIWWTKILHWGGTLQDFDLGRLSSQPLNGGYWKVDWWGPVRIWIYLDWSEIIYIKNSFLIVYFFLEHVRNTSNKCILSILSYLFIWYHKKSYEIIWHHIVSYDIIWYHMTSYDVIGKV